MKIKTLALMVSFVSASAVAADGPTAPFNEAVQIVNGRRVVEVAPFPAHMKSMVPTFKKPEEFPSPRSVTVIETEAGLMDCVMTYWYHPKACSPSTFGKTKLDRTWMVLMHRQWFGCGSHSSVKTCAPLIVDGKLRFLPSAVE